MQRRVPAVLGGVDVGARPEQHAADLEVTAGGGRMQRLVGEGVLGVDVDRRSGRDELPCRLDLAEEARVVQRGESVWRERRSRRGIGSQPFPKSIDVPECRRLEDVELRIGGQ